MLNNNYDNFSLVYLTIIFSHYYYFNYSSYWYLYFILLPRKVYTNVAVIVSHIRMTKNKIIFFYQFLLKMLLVCIYVLAFIFIPNFKLWSMNRHNFIIFSSHYIHLIFNFLAILYILKVMAMSTFKFLLPIVKNIIIILESFVSCTPHPFSGRHVSQYKKIAYV